MAASFQAYRNLHKPGCFSIKHKGLVIDYATTMVMRGCRFFVSEKGRLRTVARRRKGVHAWIVGKSYEILPADLDIPNNEAYEEAWYSPYFTQKFYGINTGKIYEFADEVYFVNNKCYCKIINEIGAE